MSTETTVVFYGIRVNVAEDEIPALEDRSDARLVRARRHGLGWYWGNFAEPRERYLLFIGEKIGVMGFENAREVEISRQSLMDRMHDTDEKLKGAGFTGYPSLYVQWQKDA